MGCDWQDSCTGTFDIPAAVINVSTNPIYKGNLVQVVTMTYDRLMNSSIEPTITFMSVMLSTFVSRDDGAWSADNLTWTETFDVSDSDDESSSVMAQSSGAKDLAGIEENTNYNTVELFDVDTKAPSIWQIYFGDDEYINAEEAQSGVNIQVTFWDPENSDNSSIFYTNGQSVSCNLSNMTDSNIFGPLTGLRSGFEAIIPTGNLSSLNDGELMVSCTVQDLAGNIEIGGIDSTTKDATIPNISLSSICMGINPCGPNTPWTVEVDWGESLSCEYSYDGENYRSNPFGCNANLPNPVNEGYPEGEYRLYLRGTDAAWNVATANSSNFTWDQTQPDISVSICGGDNYCGPNDPWNITVNWSDSSTCEYSYDNWGITNYSNCSLTGEDIYNPEYAEGGPYGIAIRGRDNAGNFLDPSLTFSIDATVPTVDSIVSNDGDNITKKGVNVTITTVFNEGMTNTPVIAINYSDDENCTDSEESMTFVGGNTTIISGKFPSAVKTAKPI
jgi:hypothetical protein